MNHNMKKTILSMITLAAMMMAAPTQVLAETSAVEMVDLEAQDIAVSYTNGVMHITGANGLVVKVYNLAGIVVKSFMVEGQDKRISMPLSDGIYIIKVGPSFTRKITVNRR